MVPYALYIIVYSTSNGLENDNGNYVGPCSIVDGRHPVPSQVSTQTEAIKEPSSVLNKKNHCSKPRNVTCP